MPVVRKWVLYDPLVPEEYVFEINPNEDGSPGINKTITYSNTAAPDGKTLLFEGRDQPQKINYSGVLLTKDQYDALTYWFTKRHQVRLTDDLGREFWLYIESFVPKRVRVASHPWKHTYTMSATILDYPTP